MGGKGTVQKPQGEQGPNPELGPPWAQWEFGVYNVGRQEGRAGMRKRHWGHSHGLEQCTAGVFSWMCPSSGVYQAPECACKGKPHVTAPKGQSDKIPACTKAGKLHSEMTLFAKWEGPFMAVFLMRGGEERERATGPKKKVKLELRDSETVF